MQPVARYSHWVTAKRRRAERCSLSLLRVLAWHPHGRKNPAMRHPAPNQNERELDRIGVAGVKAHRLACLLEHEPSSCPTTASGFGESGVRVVGPAPGPLYLGLTAPGPPRRAGLEETMLGARSGNKGLIAGVFGPVPPPLRGAPCSLTRPLWRPKPWRHKGQYIPPWNSPSLTIRPIHATPLQAIRVPVLLPRLHACPNWHRKSQFIGQLLGSFCQNPSNKVVER
jgi:hypothetical protein